LENFSSGGNYNLSLLASSNNNSNDSAFAYSSGNYVATMTAASVSGDLATGGVGNDYVSGSSLLSGDGYFPTFVGGAGNDVFDHFTGGMAFAGGSGSDTAIMKASDIQITDGFIAQDGSLGFHYSISMIPIAKAQEQANYFNLSQNFVDALTSSSSYSGSQSALLAIDTVNGKAYTDAETLVVANSANTTDVSQNSVNDVFTLGTDANNGNRLQLHLSDSGVRLAAGGLSDDIMGGAGNDVIYGGGNGNGVLINGQSLAPDVISGGAGNDVLAGGSNTPNTVSNDVSYLDGGQGDDVLVAVSGTVYATGGTGRDVFALYSDSDSVNLIIKDFDASNDRIDLSALTALKNLVVADNAASLDQVQALKNLLSSPNTLTTDANGDIHINLDSFLSSTAQAAGLHAEITVLASGMTNGHLSTQNLVFSEQSWSPYHWHDNLNPLVSG
jgi:Ca2+-binding RTX toxin-like protein